MIFIKSYSSFVLFACFVVKSFFSVQPLRSLGWAQDMLYEINFGFWFRIGCSAFNRRIAPEKKPPPDVLARQE